jgi:hypothetical protein
LDFVADARATSERFGVDLFRFGLRAVTARRTGFALRRLAFDEALLD